MSNQYTPEKQTNKFWSRINKNGSIPVHCPELGQCWEWTGYCMPNGYGQTSWNGKHIYSHRVAWMLPNYIIPEGMDICHSCDNRKCCNPKHLWLGTRQENIVDMRKKGRHFPIEQFNGSGEDNLNHKLTDIQVAEIRKCYAAGGTTHRKLAAEYGITHTHVGYIVRLKVRI